MMTTDPPHEPARCQTGLTTPPPSWTLSENGSPHSPSGSPPEGEPNAPPHCCPKAPAGTPQTQTSPRDDPVYAPPIPVADPPDPHTHPRSAEAPAADADVACHEGNGWDESSSWPGDRGL